MDLHLSSAFARAIASAVGARAAAFPAGDPRAVASFTAATLAAAGLQVGLPLNQDYGHDLFDPDGRKEALEQFQGLKVELVYMVPVWMPFEKSFQEVGWSDFRKKYTGYLRFCTSVA